MARPPSAPVSSWVPAHSAPETRVHRCGGEDCRAVVWRFPGGLLSVSSAPLGGGIGRRSWVLNAQVPHAYSRVDPDVHLTELATAFGLDGPGVGMLTAVDLRRMSSAQEDGCRADVS
ncbi:MAG: adenosylcobinamide amidohydrolase, partial [Acidimicrobiales bacterium]